MKSTVLTSHLKNGARKNSGMYNKFEIAWKYLTYQLTASNSKGHGVHPPFVYNFIVEVLNDVSRNNEWFAIELLRNSLEKDNTLLEVEDFGAGSTTKASTQRTVSSIAKSALKPRKYAELIARIAKYYSCNNILELGTSLGITTSFLANSSPFCRVVTCEGSKAIATVAKQNFDKLFLQNVLLLQGEFTTTYDTAINSLGSIDLLFIDGNHQETPTVHYFTKALPNLHKQSVIIFDDIHWSKGMENAWETIKNHDAVSETIDLFFMGIVFLRDAQKAKQHFVIRF
jgi:predicted O-methyltransferase YrrM